MAIGLLAAVIAAALPAPAEGTQQGLEMTRVFGDDGETFLFDVRDAAPRGAELAVLTEPEPAVHIFGPGERRSWGREGAGPAELASPVDVERVEGAVLVLDVNQTKIVQYDESGGFVASRTTDGVRANRMWIRAGDTILAAFTPMTDARAALRLRGDRTDTLFTYERRGRSIRLEAPGAPSLTVKAPFTPQVEWTVLADGGLVRFDPETQTLEWLDREGSRVVEVDVPWDPLPLETEDREWWITTTTSREFFGRRIFEPLRPVAEETVEFPGRLPLVLEALGDPHGGAWFRRTTPRARERWMLMHREHGVVGEVVLPAGRELLAVGEDELFALARDELGVERVEAYRRPSWDSWEGSR